MTYINNDRIEITTNNLITVNGSIVGRIAKMRNIRAPKVSVYTKGDGRDYDVEHVFEGQVYTMGSPCKISEGFLNFCKSL